MTSVIASATILADAPHCCYYHDRHIYGDPTSNDALLHLVEPSLIDMHSKLISATTSIYDEPNQRLEVVPARRTFIDTEYHRALTADSLSEI